MGKKSKRTKARGAHAPRPLGWTPPSPSASMPTPNAAGRAQPVFSASLVQALLKSGKYAPSLIFDNAIQSVADNKEAPVATSSDVLPTISPVNDLKPILEQGAAASLDGYRPSVDAVWRCCRNDFSGEGIRYLLRDKGGIYRCNERHTLNNTTPLSICCLRGNLKGLKAMLEVANEFGYQLDASIAEKDTGVEPLAYAVQSRMNQDALGSIEDFCMIIKLLVTKLGRNLEHVQGTGPPGTALARSAELGERRLVETCLELGADVNRPSIHNEGLTPLHFAVWSGSITITQLLLDHGANTRALVDDYILPIGYSTPNSMNFACADLIMRHEQDLELPPLSSELEVLNNIILITEGVEKFRLTGNAVSQPICLADLREDAKEARVYEEHVRSRAKRNQSKYKDETCDFCGAHGAGLKTCSKCKVAKYCGLSCQKKAWKEHKADCVAPSK